MICIYDTVLTGKPETFRRYGVTYRLERRFRMGNRVLYSYVAPGVEKLLVIPGFAEQYREAEAKSQRFGTGKTLEEYQRLIRKHINNLIVTEEMSGSGSGDSTMYLITADYKDISITFEYQNRSLAIGQEFEIRDNNLFGNGIVVLMNIDMEDAL